MPLINKGKQINAKLGNAEKRNCHTRASGSAPAARSLLTMGMWFLQVAIWRGVSPKLFLKLILPPLFFNDAKASSTSPREPPRTTSHRSFWDPVHEILRPVVCKFGFCTWGETATSIITKRELQVCQLYFTILYLRYERWLQWLSSYIPIIHHLIISKPDSQNYFISRLHSKIYSSEPWVHQLILTNPWKCKIVIKTSTRDIQLHEELALC